MGIEFLFPCEGRGPDSAQSAECAAAHYYFGAGPLPSQGNSK